jgi:hypothetical protein
MPEREARAGQHEPGEARGNREGEARTDEGAGARRDDDARGRVEIEPGVRRARVARERHIRVEPLYVDAHDMTVAMVRGF